MIKEFDYVVFEGPPDKDENKDDHCTIEEAIEIVKKNSKKYKEFKETQRNVQVPQGGNKDHMEKMRKSRTNPGGKGAKRCRHRT